MHKLYDTYASSDIAGAKEPLRDMIELSLAEKQQARFYWSFDLQIAFSQARLAIIDESQGETNEAAQLYAQASDNMLIGTKAFRQAMRKEGSVKFTDSDSEAEKRWTPDQWRMWIAALDHDNRVRWELSKVLDKTTKQPVVDARLYDKRYPKQIVTTAADGSFDFLRINAWHHVPTMVPGPDLTTNSFLIVEASGYRTAEVDMPLQFDWPGRIIYLTPINAP